MKDMQSVNFSKALRIRGSRECEIVKFFSNLPQNPTLPHVKNAVYSIIPLGARL